MARFFSITSTPVISTGIYAALDQIGGVQALAAEDFKKGALLTGVTLIDKDDEAGVYDILLFDSDPTTDISSSDNAALALSDAGAAKLLYKFQIVAGDYLNLPSNQVAHKLIADAPVYSASNGDSIYWVAQITSGTPTFTATSDLVFKFHFKSA